jgi:hypothetical protein
MGSDADAELKMWDLEDTQPRHAVERRAPSPSAERDAPLSTDNLAASLIQGG